MNPITPDRNTTILMVDDDPDDFYLAKHAFRQSGQQRHFQLMSDGDELMDYLHRRGRFSNLDHTSLPCLILLDLNMPKKDGREVLREIKAEPDFRRIPIVVFTTSSEEDDIISSYESGANSYIVKPNKFDALVKVMRFIGDYWLNIVRLPDLSHREMLGFAVS